MERHADQSLDISAVLLMTLVCAIWGGAFVAIKIGLMDLPALGSAALRFLLTTVILFLWARAKKVPLFYQGRERRALLLLALLFFYVNLMVYVGTAQTTSGRATVFFYSQPVFLAIIAPFFLPQEQMTLRKGWGLLLALVGLALLFLTKVNAGRVPTLLGDALVLSAAVATAVQNLIMKREAGKIHPVALILWSSFVSAFLLAVCSGVFERHAVFVFSGRAIASLLYLSLISAAFGFVVFAWLIQRYSATRVTTLVFLAPVFGVGFGWLLLQETLTLVQSVGVVGVCAGVYVVTSGGAQRTAVATADMARPAILFFRSFLNRVRRLGIHSR
jgi:drug/metabolite transporter (DMT)-like permease